MVLEELVRLDPLDDIQQCASERLDLKHWHLYNRVLISYTGLLMRSGQYFKANDMLLKAQASVQRRGFEQFIDGLTTAVRNSFVDCKIAMLLLNGKYEYATFLQTQSLLNKRQSFSGDYHPTIASALCRLGSLKLKSCEFDEAAQLLEDSLAMRRQLYGRADHPAVGASLFVRAEAFLQLGRYSEALADATRSLEINITKLGAKHPSSARCVLLLAIIQNASGDPMRARKNLAYALQVFREKYGIDKHRDVADCVFEMGRNALCRGYFQEAVSCFEEALRSRESLSIVSSMHASVDSREWTGRNGSTISSDSNIILDVEVVKLYLAQSYGYVSRLEEAKVVMMSAVKAITAVLGNRNDLTALALCRLGEICRMRGNTSHARQLLSISFKVTQELFGDEHPQVATLMLESSENLRAPGYYEDCEDLCRNALDVRSLVFGSSNVFTALAVHHKAQLRFDAGKLADAEELYMHSMRLLITQLGEDSGYYAVVLSDFAEFCRATGNFDAAEKHFQRAMEGLKKTYGEKTISVHSTLCNYALLLLDCHQPMDAYNVLMKTVVPFFDKLLGHVHPRTLYARANAALAAQFSSFSQHQGTAEGSSVALLSLRVAVCFLD